MPRARQSTTDNTNLPPITTKEIVVRLRDKIRTGKLVPGQRLVEADLVKEMGSGRTKIREALQRLEAEGLVDIEEFRGASVRQLSMDEIHQIYKIRIALESMAAAEFAASKNSLLKKKLQSLQDDMNALESSGDHVRFAKLNDAWHALIIEGSGNTYAAQFLSQLSVPIYRLLFSTFYNAQRLDRANSDHQMITSAIINSKPELASQAMRDHIQDGLIALSEIKTQLDL